MSSNDLPETGLKLFMLLLGCKPPGRHTEQHDVFFGIARSLRDLVPEIQAFGLSRKGFTLMPGAR